MPQPPTEEQRRRALSHLRSFEDRARRFSGWDFEDLGVRSLDKGPPWSYERIAASLASDRDTVLDLGTGGGELLAQLRPTMHGRIVATEPWVVNAPVAYRRLSPLGIHLLRAQSTRLPFHDASFDLVIDRHEEFDPSEVSRILSHGGRFLTQQVGRENWTELRRHFPRMTDLGDLKSAYRRAFQLLGFDVELQEHRYRVVYPSLGEFVFILCVAPWEIPGFDVERDLDALLAFESECHTPEGLVVTESRYLLHAWKPG